MLSKLSLTAMTLVLCIQAAEAGDSFEALGNWSVSSPEWDYKATAHVDTLQKGRNAAANLIHFTTGVGVETLNRADRFHVLFTRNSSEVESGVLAPMIESITQNPKVKSLLILGHATSSGAPDLNSTLAIERARAIESALKPSIPGDIHIQIISGNVDLSIDPSLDRRAEVWLLD